MGMLGGFFSAPTARARRDVTPAPNLAPGIERDTPEAADPGARPRVRVPVAAKLAWVAAIAAGAGMLALTLLSATHDVLSLRPQFSRALAEQTRVTALAVLPAVRAQRATQIAPILDALLPSTGLRSAALYNAAGQRIYTATPPGAPPTWALPNAYQGIASAAQVHGGQAISTAILGPPARPDGHLVVIAQWPSPWSGMRGQVAVSAVGMAIGLLVSILTALTLTPAISRPLRALTQTARAIARQRDFGVRAVISTRDEFADLSRALNQALMVLESHDRGLTRARLELEERIDERTQALRQENAERRRAEHDRATALAQREQIMENVQDVIYALDAQGNLTSFNRRLNALTGLGAPALSGRPLAELFVESDRPAVVQAVRRALREGRATAEARLCHADGEITCLELSGRALLDRDDRPIGITGVARDVTARRAAEAEILRLNADLERRVHQRTTQLEAANQELEAFSYSVSHDLRAPLRAIEGFSRALAEDLGAQLPPNAHTSLERILAATARMGALIADLLELARMSQVELTVQPVDLSALAERVGAALAQAHPERHVALHVEPGLSTTGDPKLLEIVLENLLGNAWKFTARQPHAAVTVLRTTREGRTAVCVRDNGAGFDMAHAKRLFDPFQRLHSDAAFPGTGVGLATVKRIVQRHGGELWAHGMPDAGASFFFTLPEAP